MSQHHNLKAIQPYFGHVRSGIKTFELRKNDRNFMVGDSVSLGEFNPEFGYTGETVNLVITYVLQVFTATHPTLQANPPLAEALAEGWCIFGFRIDDTPEGTPA